jgi:hypothetical protein
MVRYGRVSSVVCRARTSLTVCQSSARQAGCELQIECWSGTAARRQTSDLRGTRFDRPPTAAWSRKVALTVKELGECRVAFAVASVTSSRWRRLASPGERR